MKLGDLLSFVDGAPLKQFTRAAAIVPAINALLSSDTQLTENSTGAEVLVALNTLSTDVRVKLLLSDIDPITGKIAGPLVVIAPDATVVLSTRSLRSMMSLVIGGTLVLIALAMATGVTMTTLKTGQMPDSASLKTVVEVLGDIAKAFNDSNDTATPSPPASP